MVSLLLLFLLLVVAVEVLVLLLVLVCFTHAKLMHFPSFSHHLFLVNKLRPVTQVSVVNIMNAHPLNIHLNILTADVIAGNFRENTSTQANT